MSEDDRPAPGAPDQDRRSQDGHNQDGTDARRAAAAAAARILFDDPLTGRSRDDTDAGWSEPEAGGSRRDLDWYLRETPPQPWRASRSRISPSSSTWLGSSVCCAGISTTTASVSLRRFSSRVIGSTRQK